MTGVQTCALPISAGTDASGSYDASGNYTPPAGTGTDASGYTAPTSAFSLASTSEDSNTYTINASDILSKYNDVDSSGLSIQNISVSNGYLTQNAGNTSWTWQPEPDFYGNVTVNYTINDGDGASVSGTTSFSVDAVNDAPVLANGSDLLRDLTVLEDSASQSLNLSNVSYSPGNKESAQQLTYTVSAIPGTLGQVGTSDASGNFTAVAVNDLLTLPELQALEFKAAPNQTGSAQFSDRKSTRLNSSHSQQSRMPSSA